MLLIFQNSNGLYKNMVYAYCIDWLAYASLVRDKDLDSLKNTSVLLGSLSMSKERIAFQLAALLKSVIE